LHPPDGMRRMGCLCFVVCLGSLLPPAILDSPQAFARGSRRPHNPHTPKPRRPPVPVGLGPPVGPVNQLMVEEGRIELPGRGQALAWSPTGSSLAVGGHFAEKTTGLRYDTRVYDVGSKSFDRTYACHHYWVTATAWTINPFLGETLVSGGADHAIRIWDATSRGSTRCQPGQFRAADGGKKLLPNVNGWTMALAFSPDGRYLAGASRDRMVRIWQIEPGPTQWQVVLAWYEHESGNILSLAWSPDGRALVTGDRRGRVARWEVDPDGGRWDDATIAEFARVGWEGLMAWVGDHRATVTRIPAWIDADHGQVWNVRVAPDGTSVVAAGGDGTVSAYESASGRVLWRHAGPVGRAFEGLDWHPGGALVAAGASDGSIVLLQASDGAVVDRLTGHSDDVAALAWSPDGLRLASTAGGLRLSFATAALVAGPDMTARIWAWR
jgi:WD40 repeat protein